MSVLPKNLHYLPNLRKKCRQTLTFRHFFSMLLVKARERRGSRVKITYNMERLREIVDDPIFDAEELTLEAVYRRAYKVQDAGDTDGWRMRFSVKYGDVIVSVSTKGVDPEWVYQQLMNLISD